MSDGFDLEADDINGECRSGNVSITLDGLEGSVTVTTLPMNAPDDHPDDGLAVAIRGGDGEGERLSASAIISKRELLAGLEVMDE